MNKHLLSGLAVLASVVTAHAQGTVSLTTVGTARYGPIRVNGKNATPGDNIWVQVLVAGATSLIGSGADPFQLTLGGSNAGLFSKGILTVGGKPGGSAVDITIRAWDKDTGATFETAKACASVTLVGFVLGGVLSSEGFPTVPSQLGSVFWGLDVGLCPILYTEGQTQLEYTASDGRVTILKYHCSEGGVTIPETINGLAVTEIADSAFSGCTSLTQITIPNSVTRIGLAAFQDCTHLVGVALGKGVTSIGDGAFAGCTSLTGITVPDSVTRIERQTFDNCTNLANVTIGSGVTGIGSFAFRDCSSLVSVTIPSSVIQIDGWAFQNCTRLSSLTIPTGAHVIDYAFIGCAGLASIAIPAGVTSMNGSFTGCSGLTAITVESLNKFYSSVDGVLFNKLQSVLLQYPAAKAASSYGIPDGVTEIQTDAFSDCASLSSVSIPDSVSTIFGYPFARCHSLTAITLGALNPSYSSVDGVLFNKDGKILSRFPENKAGSSYAIPQGTITIAGFAFSGADSLNQISIPESASNLQDFFGEAKSLTTIVVDPLNPYLSSVDGVLFNKKLSELLRYPAAKPGSSYVVPEGISFILNSAFSHCTRLVNVTIPKSATEKPLASNRWFIGCPNLTAIYFEGNVPVTGFALLEADSQATLYYLAESLGWGPTILGHPTALWHPRVESSGAGLFGRTNPFEFDIAWARDRVVVVEAANGLKDPVWSPVGTYTLTGGSAHVTDPQGIGQPSRFYRVVSP